MVTIDSLKMRFDLKDVKIINPALIKLYGECMVNEDSGEIEVSPDEFKKKAYDVRENGKTTRYHILKRRVNQFETRESLIIMANSKILEDEYFEGIWTHTISRFYRAIIDQGVIDIPFDKFVQGDLTDVDIKRDFQVKDLEGQKKVVQIYKELSRPSARKDAGYHSHAGNDNIGIEWSSRAHATPSNPYFKMYAKDVELRTKSAFFKMMYLHTDIPPIMRWEGTIKNRAHYRKLFRKDEFSQFRLCDLVGEVDLIMERVITDMLLCHVSIDGVVPLDVTRSMTLSEVFATSLLLVTKSLELAKIQSDRIAPNRKQAYLAREKLIYCYNAYVPDNEKVQFDEGLDEMLSLTQNARAKEERFLQIDKSDFGTVNIESGFNSLNEKL